MKFIRRALVTDEISRRRRCRASDAPIDALADSSARQPTGYRVLASFAQVADTLHGLQNDADSLQSQQKALASANSALELVRQGYRVGNAGIVQIVTAQRLQQLADLGVVQARAQRYADTVKLCLASGGGVS